MSADGRLFLMAIGTAAAVSMARQAMAQAPTTVFVDVSVVPMDRERVLSRQTVVVRDGRIVALGAVGRTSVPAGATRIDGRGKFLMPGLSDCHAHNVGNGTGLFAYLANGVTTVRDMHGGGPASRALEAKRAVEGGAVLGPRIYTAGDPDVPVWHEPMVYPDAPPFGGDPAVAARGTAALKAAGHDFVKVYGWPRPVYDSILAVAREIGLPIAGHVPEDIGLVGALRDRWASIEHLGTGGTGSGYFEAVTGLAMHDTAAWMRPDLRLDTVRLRDVAEATRDAGVWNCPTLNAIAARGDTAIFQTLSGPFALGVRWNWWRNRVAPQVVKALQDAGAGLLLGTDGDAFAVHEELRALVEAGLTPYQALAAGTRNLAEFLGTADSTGTIAIGKVADLVLLHGNPLDDISYTAGSSGVVVRGRWIPRVEIDAQLDRLGQADPNVEARRRAVWRPIPVVIDRVTVVDVERGRLLAEQRVVIAGRRIQSVSPVRSSPLPSDARVVDGRGKYLIPGLWDMHIHPACHPEVFYPLLIANGVTGIRDAGTTVPLDTVLEWRREILDGARVGPRMVVAGGYLNEFPQSIGEVCGDRPIAVVVTTPADVRRAVDSLQQAGADLIKYHVFDSVRARPLYFAMAAEARRVGIPFGGHIPTGYVTELEASDSGAGMLDHYGVLPVCVPGAGSRKACDTAAATLRRNGTWLVTTMVMGIGSPLSARVRAQRFWPDSVRRMVGYENVSDTALMGVTARPDSVNTASSMELMRRAGVPLVTGTDAAPVFIAVAPGYSLQDELETLVWAGLTPLGVLQAATLNPAKALRATDSLGTVAAGKLADLVLLDGNPLADIRNTQKIVAVVANGRYFDRAALNALLGGVERRARGGQEPPRAP